MQIVGILALTIPLLGVVLLAKAPYRWPLAHSVATFTVCAAAYVWLTLGSISEFSRLVILEAFMPTLLVIPAVIYVGAFLKSRQRKAA